MNWRKKSFGISTSNGETKLFYINIHLFGRVFSVTRATLFKFIGWCVSFYVAYGQIVQPVVDDWRLLKSDMTQIKEQVNRLNSSDDKQQIYIDEQLLKERALRIADSILTQRIKLYGKGEPE